MPTPAELRAHAARLLDEAERLQAKVPRNHAELRDLARTDPTLVTELHERGELAHLVESEQDYRARTAAKITDPRQLPTGQSN